MGIRIIVLPFKDCPRKPLREGPSKFRFRFCESKGSFRGREGRAGKEGARSEAVIERRRPRPHPQVKSEDENSAEYFKGRKQRDSQK